MENKLYRTHLSPTDTPETPKTIFLAGCRRSWKSAVIILANNSLPAAFEKITGRLGKYDTLSHEAHDALTVILPKMPKETPQQFIAANASTPT